MFALVALSALVAALPGALGATYSLSLNNVGQDFLNNFIHQDIPDPTAGRVQYVDQPTALAENLTFASADSFIMRADSTTVLTPTGPGRKSVRIKSNLAFEEHVLVMDIRHMPEGCGTWPAAWEVKEDTWPNTGEVDIIEGVNNAEPNQSTLHTSAGCSVPATGTGQSGTTLQTDCDVAVNGNAGCGVHAPTPDSFGPAFNAAGGGFYAMERTASVINVWFWSRADPSVPADVAAQTGSVVTDNFGQPIAIFPNTQCDFASHFGAHNVIVDLTFCGDFAGPLFAGDGCGADCNAFVESNPAAFVDAFWDFARMSVYE